MGAPKKYPGKLTKRKQAAEKEPILKMEKRTKEEQHRSMRLVDMQYCFANTSHDTVHVYFL